MTVGLWLALAAFARKPPPAPVAPAPDPWAAQEAVACEKDTPENYQVHTGYASGADPTTAVEEARRAARKLALESVCSGKSASRCLVLGRHVEDWKQPFHNPSSGRACAHVAIHRQWLHDDTREQQALSDALKALAARAAEQVGQDLLWLEPPLWSSSGCAVGEVGSALVAELRNGLAGVGTVRLAASGDRATTMGVSLDARGDQVVLSASLRQPGRSGEIPLPGFSFSADLFDLGPGGGDCRFDQELGLEDGHRVGKDGRTVRLGVPGATFCEGDRVEPVVVVDRPSVVRVFSVSRSGKAYLVWPPPGETGKVEQHVSLGSFDLVPTPEGGSEKLVAVAAADAAGLGIAAGWSGFCEVPAFGASTLPASTAAGAATLEVLRFDADACLVRGVKSRPAAAIPQVGACR